jgi:prenyltransferase beta subunit
LSVHLLSLSNDIILSAGGEAHGGSTYCAVASLALMGVLPICSAEYPNSDHASKSDAVAENILARLQNWCLQR